MGGTVTAEHGIGLSRREALVDQVGPDVIDVMRSIKTALDPLGILNPGRVHRGLTGARSQPALPGRPRLRAAVLHAPPSPLPPTPRSRRPAATLAHLYRTNVQARSPAESCPTSSS